MNLTEDQVKAINEIDNNLQIIACAGSGKTEVISKRIGNILKNKNNIKPENIVAFTFTEKAAASLKRRIKKEIEEMDISSMYIGTIHSFCYNILKANCPEYEKFKILDSVRNYHFINRYSKKCGMETAELQCYPRNIKLFLDCIDKLVYDFDNYELWSEKDKKIFNEYKQCLYDKQYFDFSMLIHETLKVLKNKNDLLFNIKYLIVDEYQDVDDLQEELIECFNYNKCNICVVGDDDQTIYRFRGSNSKNMINFSNKYPNVKQIRLEKNFRCINSIVDIADNVIINNKDRLDKKMISGKEILSNNKVKALGFEDKDNEYNYISSYIKKLNISGMEYKNIAILVRKGKHIKDIVHHLNSHMIPYISDSAEYFFENEYFTLFKNTINILLNLSKKELYDLWENYSIREKFNSGFIFLRSSISNSNYLNLSDILNQFVNKIGFFDECEDVELRKDVLNGMLDILNDFEEIYLDYERTAKINGIMDFLNSSAAEQYKYHNFKSTEIEDGVQIMTIHKSKGLEFDSVIIPNMDSKEFPSCNVGGKKYWHILSDRFKDNKEIFEGDIEDERKLFYVAITRAKEKLLLTYNINKPSLFLREASKSKYLDININDLNSINIKDRYGSDGKYLYNETNNKKEYWNLVKKARDSLYNYYWTGGHFFKGMYGEIERIKEMTPDEIIEEAKRNHLI